MAVRVGINGFGRIGRQSLKALIERAPDVEVVAVNDLVDVELNALLFKHDSTYGAYPGTVEHTADSLVVDGRDIRVLREKDPATLPWGDLGVDIVVESTGIFTDATKAKAHLDAGALGSGNRMAGDKVRKFSTQRLARGRNGGLRHIGKIHARLTESGQANTDLRVLRELARLAKGSNVGADSFESLRHWPVISGQDIYMTVRHDNRLHMHYLTLITIHK